MKSQQFCGERFVYIYILTQNNKSCYNKGTSNGIN
nr:MAG TPA: hypothetical protein [Caudoviricetes sp.]